MEFWGLIFIKKGEGQVKIENFVSKNLVLSPRLLDQPLWLLDF
jgi:hypothetical protein